MKRDIPEQVREKLEDLICGKTEYIKIKSYNLRFRDKRYEVIMYNEERFSQSVVYNITEEQLEKYKSLYKLI